VIADTKSWVPTRYKIGDVDGCVRAAVDYANSRHNVYIEARTIRPETSPGERGDTADTAWVVAFVIDSDADKGKGFDLGEIQPTLTVESSPGNEHFWFFLEKAIPADDVAKKVGDAMRKAGSDPGATGKVAQPYRVAGTPNFPNKKKRDSGRVLCATRVLYYRPEVLWTPERLLAVFAPPQKEQKRQSGAKADPRHTDERLLSPAMLAEIQTDVPEGERSQRFFGVVAKLKRKLWPVFQSTTFDKIVELFERYPNGIANKYAGRLHEEAKRCYDKIDEGRDSLPVIDIKPGEIPRMLSESKGALDQAGVPLYARGRWTQDQNHGSDGSYDSQHHA
jgi:hypothetical protein